MDLLAGSSTGGVIDLEEAEYGLGFEVYPRWLVLRGVESLETTGRLFHPDEFLDLPTAWVNDVFSLLRWKSAKQRDKKKDKNA
jgi:hypothetical protein